MALRTRSQQRGLPEWPGRLNRELTFQVRAARAAPTSPDREPYRLAAAATAPWRSGFPNTLACFYALRDGSRSAPEESRDTPARSSP